MFAKFAGETTRRLDLLTKDLAAFKATTASRLDSLAADNDTLKSDVRDVKTAITRLTNDVGELKGAHAEANARAKIALIADELDLEHRRIVPEVELRHMARDGGADLRDDAIKRFVTSDIIAETTDAEGETTYLAVETSYTGGRAEVAPTMQSYPLNAKGNLGGRRGRRLGRWVRNPLAAVPREQECSGES